MKSVFHFVALRLERMSDTKANIMVNTFLLVVAYSIVLCAMHLFGYEIGIKEALIAVVLAEGLIFGVLMVIVFPIVSEIRWYRWNKH